MPQVYPLQNAQRYLGNSLADDTTAICVLQSIATRDSQHGLETRGLLLPSPQKVGGSALPGLVVNHISGTVSEGLSPVARVVRAYRRSDGALVGTTVSVAGTGAFSMPIYGTPEEVTVVAFDDASGLSYNAAIADKVIPA